MRLIPVAYLGSYLMSVLGNSVAAVALPLIVLQTTGSALSAGAVAAATAVPAVLAGLFMGVVIDRVNRRTSSVVTDLVSAGAVAALPVVDLVTGLSLGWFVLLGAIGAFGDVPGMTAREALLPAIARHGDLSVERLVGAREALGALALLVGPAAAGLLMALLDGATVLWITAATSLLAALTTLLVPHAVGRVEKGSAVSSSWAQVREGWHTLLASRFLVVLTGLTLVSVFVLGAFQGLVLPVYFTAEDQPGRLGLVLTALAAGLLLGSGAYLAAGPRVRRRTWLLTGLLGSVVGFGVMAALGSWWLVLVGAFVVGVFSGLFSSLLGVLTVERVPDALRGRITGTQNALVTAVGPLAIVVAAVIVEYVGLREAAMLVAAVWVLAALAAAPGRWLDLPVTPAPALQEDEHAQR
ncbi:MULTISPECIES: MFS transporter [unclassified Nocardioides]|uniref:MFS transporter n=1 Tax=unclassified Nocardioides TaxID=2615069 RepID=UPI00301493D3